MSARRPPTWPVIPLALPAAVSIWAGWVGLGQLTGFGVVQLLPGIWDELTINTAVTLPIGMESYAAFALYVWLHRGTPRRARDFARISSIAALTLGALGQVAYHLMVAAGIETAPWPITAAVACLPVAVLGMGCTLAHLLTVDDEPRALDRQPSNNTPADLREAVSSVRPPFRPAMSAPPVSPPVAPVAPFARVGATPDHPAATPRPPVDQEPPTAPVTTDEGPVSSAPQPDPVPPDDPVVAQVRDMVTAAQREGRPVGRRPVAKALGVSEHQASLLLAQVAATPAGPPTHNGAATRKEGTR